jgi:proteasome lid subunit RPN8/RPN11
MAKTSIQDTVLWLSSEIYKELLYYARSVDAEVGGLGYLTFDTKNNDITVEELYLLEQEVNNSECELSAVGISKLYEELIAAGEDDKLGGINFWWHSHKDIGAFFSTTDDTTMKEWTGPYIVALVINRKGEMKSSLLTRTPIMIVGEIDVKIDWSLSEQKADILDEVIAEKVTIKQPTIVVYQKPSSPTPHQNYGYMGYGDYGIPYQGKSIHSMTDEEFKKEMEGDISSLAVVLSDKKLDALEKSWTSDDWSMED